MPPIPCWDTVLPLIVLLLTCMVAEFAMPPPVEPKMAPPVLLLIVLALIVKVPRFHKPPPSPIVVLLLIVLLLITIPAVLKIPPPADYATCNDDGYDDSQEYSHTDDAEHDVHRARSETGHQLTLLHGDFLLPRPQVLDDGERLTASPISFDDRTVIVPQMHCTTPVIGGNIGGNLCQIETFLGRGLYFQPIERIQSHRGGNG